MSRRLGSVIVSVSVVPPLRGSTFCLLHRGLTPAAHTNVATAWLHHVSRRGLILRYIARFMLPPLAHRAGSFVLVSLDRTPISATGRRSRPVQTLRGSTFRLLHRGLTPAAHTNVATAWLHHVSRRGLILRYIARFMLPPLAHRAGSFGRASLDRTPISATGRRSRSVQTKSAPRHIPDGRAA